MFLLLHSTQKSAYVFCVTLLKKPGFEDKVISNATLPLTVSGCALKAHAGEEATLYIGAWVFIVHCSLSPQKIHSLC